MEVPAAKSAVSRSQVFIVDDHPLLRESLATLFDRQPDLQVCGQANDSAAAYAEIQRLQPDIAIVDLSLPGESGLEVIKKLQALHPVPPVRVLSIHDEPCFAH